MRRMLSGLLATAMVASVCATASFAVSTDATATIFSFDFSGAQGTANTTGDITLTLPNGGQIELTCDFPQTNLPAAGAETAEYFVEHAKWKVLGKARYGQNSNGTAGRAMHSEDFFLHRDGTTVKLQTKVEGKDVDLRDILPNGNRDDSDADVVMTSTNNWGTDPVFNGVIDPIYGEDSDGDVTKTNNISADIRDIIVCDKEGNPLPLTEKKDGVDKDQNSADGVQSGQTVYFMIRNDMEWKFHDDTYWKLKVSKGDNGKYIKAISDVPKSFSDDLYSVYTHTRVPGTGGSRARYIKVEMNEIMTDDEFKVTLDLRLTAKSKAVDVFDGVDDDDEIKVKDFYFYVKNLVKAADGEWNVGVGGLMLDPVKNDWNEVTYTDEDGDVAFMKFFGDSDTGKFYAKLSTKWEHADYASYFNDQDAYIFQFTGSPNLSSTSRADLQIYSPFVDDDGNETFDPEQAVIYQVVDGDLFDITDNFEYREGDNGDMAYCTRVRFLGTFIICQKPVEEASSDDVVDLVPDDLVPDNNTGAPVEVNPGNNGGSGSKAPANTGKF